MVLDAQTNILVLDYGCTRKNASSFSIRQKPFKILSSYEKSLIMVNAPQITLRCKIFSQKNFCGKFIRFFFSFSHKN